MENPWSLKELSKYQPVLVFFFAMTAALIYQERQKSAKDDIIAAQNKELVQCNEKFSKVVADLKDEKYETALFFQRKHDSLMVLVQVNRQEVTRIKKRFK